MKVEIDLQRPPAGYEYTGEYRAPKVGEPYINPFNEGLVSKASSDYPYPRFILRELTKWRAATVEDAVKAVRGEYVIARFSDDPSCTDEEWLPGTLLGFWRSSSHPWLSQNSTDWKYCQVQE